MAMRHPTVRRRCARSRPADCSKALGPSFPGDFFERTRGRMPPIVTVQYFNRIARCLLSPIQSLFQLLSLRDPTCSRVLDRQLEYNQVYALPFILQTMNGSV
jgi:hypothetical protein